MQTRFAFGSCLFFLGTHMPNWLGLWPVPLFVSRRRLAPRRSLPRALAPWALDSGGFTEIKMHGRWATSMATYIEEARRFANEIGNLRWAAIQDWMCEPKMLERTGLSVPEHQRRTIRSYLDLRSAAPDIPWTPVLQGWERDDYLRHADDYASAGVDLASVPIVGVGSVCRRQHSAEAADIFRSLSRRGLRLHGFGVKLKGLEIAASSLTSSGSMAWSFAARRRPPMPGCTHLSCANCQRFASGWREQVLSIPGVVGEA